METMETLNYYQQEQEYQNRYEYEEYCNHQKYMYDKLVNKIKYKNVYQKIYLTTEESIFLFQNPEIKPDYILLGMEGPRYYLY